MLDNVASRLERKDVILLTVSSYADFCRSTILFALSYCCCNSVLKLDVDAVKLPNASVSAFVVSTALFPAIPCAAND